MEEKYTKLKRNAVSIIMTNVSLKMLLMFFDVWMYDREVRTPTQCRIAILGTWHRCHNRKKVGEGVDREIKILNMTVSFLHNLQELHTSQPISFIVPKPVLACYCLAYFSVRIVQSCVTGVERIMKCSSLWCVTHLQSWNTKFGIHFRGRSFV